MWIFFLDFNENGTQQQPAMEAKMERFCIKIEPSNQETAYFYKGLTFREVEVLRWSAEGKTAAEVALILDLKLRTVNFHISNAVRKMGTSNKVSAVVEAALGGVFVRAG